MHRTDDLVVTQITCNARGMARLGVAPHVADKILNHVAGTISGIAAVYQRHEFLNERRDALERWSAHVEGLLQEREAVELRAASRTGRS